jgi:hypothetical protein
MELVAPTVATLARGLLGSTAAAKLGGVTVVLITVATMLTGLAIGRRTPVQEPPPDKPPTAIVAQGMSKAAPTELSKPTRAWQRTDTYEPPDFERFFPDDPAAGVVLDQLMKNDDPTAGVVLDQLMKDYDKDSRSDVQKLRIVRQGFRRATTNRASMLLVVGNTYIRGKWPQHPDAIEIVYHAADYRVQGDNPNKTLLHAIHNGLSVVKR